MDWQPIKLMPPTGDTLVGWKNEGDTRWITARMSRKELPREHGWTHWKYLDDSVCPHCGKSKYETA